MRAERIAEDGPEEEPKRPDRILSLLRRGSQLSNPALQLEVLDALPLLDESGDRIGFASTLARGGCPPLATEQLEIFQINLGKLCNMSCRHCHVDAGPDRQDSMMDRATVDACLATLSRSGARIADLTGGAPEMSPHFSYLVESLVARGVHVIDRCNLTILLAPGYTHLPRFLADHQVEVVCSLPHYRQRNTDAQRGNGTFDRSIDALRELNRVGYGQDDPHRVLTLVANPAGAFLAGDQCSMEKEWKRELERLHGVHFDRLITLNNMPISRYLEWLMATDNLQPYMETLVAAFNPATVDGLMCRNTISVGWDGRVFDCDFNQMLDMAIDEVQHIRDFDPTTYAHRPIRTARHCFGCTAGAGSSCGGAITK